VYNYLRTRQEHLRPTSPFKMSIDGIDKDQRTVHFGDVSEPYTPGHYTAALSTLPPTQRAKALEEAVLTLITQTPGCRTSSIDRHENGAETREFYLLGVGILERNAK
jgi:hypothetical protein